MWQRQEITDLLDSVMLPTEGGEVGKKYTLACNFVIAYATFFRGIGTNLGPCSAIKFVW